MTTVPATITTDALKLNADLLAKFGPDVFMAELDESGRRDGSRRVFRAVKELLALPGAVIEIRVSAGAGGADVATITHRTADEERWSTALAKQEREALAWALELMGDCGGADALRGMVARFSLIEAEAAAMREALQRIRQGYLNGAGHASSFEVATETLDSTTTGQALLDERDQLRERVRSLEEQNNALHAFLGAITHEMEVFCDVNFTADDTRAALSSAMSMMHEWRRRYAVQFASARTDLKEDGATSTDQDRT